MDDSAERETDAFALALSELVQEAIHDSKQFLENIGNRHIPSNVGDIRPALLGGSRNLDWAKRIYAMRRKRVEYIPQEFLGEPGWDILLDLYIAYHECKTVSISSAQIAADVSGSTALRMLVKLENAGLVHRVPDETDKRRIWVCLTQKAVFAIGRICEEDAIREKKLRFEQIRKASITKKVHA